MVLTLAKLDWRIGATYLSRGYTSEVTVFLEWVWTKATTAMSSYFDKSPSMARLNSYSKSSVWPDETTNASPSASGSILRTV